MSRKDLRCGLAPCCGKHPDPPLILAPASPLSGTSLVLEQTEQKLRERLFAGEQGVCYSDLKEILQSQ